MRRVCWFLLAVWMSHSALAQSQLGLIPNEGIAWAFTIETELDPIGADSVNCSTLGDSSWQTMPFGIWPALQEATHGEFWSGAWLINIPDSIVEPISGVSYAVDQFVLTSIVVPEWLNQTFASLPLIEGGEQYCFESSGIPFDPGMQELFLEGELTIEVAGTIFDIGLHTMIGVINVVENPNPTMGCTYPLASNFSPYATVEDGSCEFWGCTDPNAENFNPFSTIDDGSCGALCAASEDDSSCTSDYDEDGLVTVSDLLILLGYFGIYCE